MKKEVREGYKMTELGEIPNDWSIKKIGDLIQCMKSGLSRNLKEDDIGIPCIRSNNIINSKICGDELKYWYLEDDKGANIRDYILNDGDILINFINSTSQIGKGCIYKDIGRPAIYTTNIFRVQMEKKVMNNLYFNYFIQTEFYKKEIVLITKLAINQASFTTGDFKNIKLVVPTIKEQEKIAEILSTVDEQIENTEKLIKKNQEFKKGLMQQLLTKGIGHTEFKKTELGDIPKEWEIKNLDEISILIDGDRSNKYPGEKDIVENGILFLSTQNIVNSKINYDNCKFISQEKFNELSKGKLKKDDLVITLRGSIGNVAKFNGDVYNTGFINAQIMIIRSKNINSNYLSNYLISDCSQKQIIKISSGSAQPQLTKRELKKIKVIIPSEKEQKKISVILSILDKKLEEYKNKKEKLELLKKGLMQQLLNGNLRVKYSY
ncbi:restriction endonuclease subunit S [Clostridium perfringens]|uniref:restriction endonuclease subunit S n=1 Tax=Clostridium perfringens TaxID=1502 RepID=UPI002ACBE9B9|nr:restriction endonuclease subunit S [Clostridium perfringens]